MADKFHKWWDKADFTAHYITIKEHEKKITELGKLFGKAIIMISNYPHRLEKAEKKRRKKAEKEVKRLKKLLTRFPKKTEVKSKNGIKI